MKSLRVFFLSLAITLLLPFIPGICSAETPGEQAIVTNPFTLEKNRLVPGSMIPFGVEKSFKDKQTISRIELEYESEGKAQGARPEKVKKVLDYSFSRGDEGDLSLMVRLPSSEEMENITGSSHFVDLLFGIHAADLMIFLKGEENPFTFQLEIPVVASAFLWGAGVVILATIFVYFLTRKWREGAPEGPLEGMIRFILSFSLTPIKSYSISKTQIMIWTYVTLFGLVYVYLLTGDFLSITDQVLMLLGVGGATAIGAKMNASSRVPDISGKYLELVRTEREQKRPRLSDLIMIDKRPNIFKFQILVFTLFTAFIVFVEILKDYAFPEIPGNLVTLMGISSGVYLGNEVVHKNPWDAVKERIETIGKKAKDGNIPIATATELADVVRKAQAQQPPPTKEERELGEEIVELTGRLRNIYAR